MEPAAKGRHRSRNGFESICPRLLLAWLKSPCGQALREAIEDELLPNLEARIFDGSEESKAVQAKVLERADKMTRAVVTVQPTETGDVEVKVYGPPELLVRTVTLPVASTTAEAQGVTDRLVELEVPRNYRPLLWPAWKRAHVILDRRYFHFWEWVAMERERAARVLESESLDQLEKTREVKQ